MALLLPAAPVPAPKDTMPKGLPPQVVMISAVSEDAIEILQTTQRQVPQQVTEQVNEGQRVVQVTRTVMVSVPVQQMIKLPLDGKGAQVYGTDGKKIDPKDVRKRVTKSVAALLSTDGKPVDPFYLRLAREGTLVIVAPTAGGEGRPLRKNFSAPDQPKKAPVPKPPGEQIERLPVEKR
jgi:hypothetical protein